VDPLEWQISQDTASNIVARLANTVGAAEGVLRVAATGHDKRLFVKVSVSFVTNLLCTRYRYYSWIMSVSKCISINISPQRFS